MTQQAVPQQWWYVENGEPKGPVEAAEIRSLVARGVLGPESMVTPVGASSWGTVSQHQVDLAPEPPTPPAPEPAPEPRPEPTAPTAVTADDAASEPAPAPEAQPAAQPSASPLPAPQPAPAPEPAPAPQPQPAPAPQPSASAASEERPAKKKASALVSGEMSGFKAFLLRGNVVDLAVAVVIGLAFGALVSAFVQDLLTPIIGIPGSADFSNLKFTINGSVFRYGAFINALITFLSIAAAVYFFVVKPVNALMAHRRTAPEVTSPTRECPECLSSIPVGARRCAFCTAKVPQVKS